MTDAVIIARGERNDRAYVPDLPGCMATGKTREDTTRMMRDAIAFHMQGLKAAGTTADACVRRWCRAGL